MSRIGDALKRAGAPDVSTGLSDMQVTAVLDHVSELPLVAETVLPREAAAAAPPLPPEAASAPESPAAPPSRPPSVLEMVAQGSAEKLVGSSELAPFAVEQYRRLAAILHHTQEARGIKKVLVASALAEEGKTLTAINLALTLSDSYERRVLLIDADLRRPGISHVFGFPHGAGLSEALQSREPQKLAMVQVSPQLWVLPAGRPTSDPMAGLTSPRMAQILEEAAERFDWVIIDSPPIGLLTDAKLLGAMADGALLVIAAASTPFDALRRATEALGKDRLLGVVLNRVDEKAVSPSSYYQYDYYYGSARGRRRSGLLRRLLRRG